MHPVALLSVVLAGSLACATTTRLESAGSFQEALALYRLSKGKKALALAVDEARGNRAWGVFYGSPGQDRANEKALEECQRNAGRAGIGAACHLFAVGDEPAPETQRACAAGEIGPKRCAAQSQWAP